MEADYKRQSQEEKKVSQGKHTRVKEHNNSTEKEQETKTTDSYSNLYTKLHYMGVYFVFLKATSLPLLLSSLVTVSMQNIFYFYAKHFLFLINIYITREVRV